MALVAKGIKKRAEVEDNVNEEEVQDSKYLNSEEEEALKKQIDSDIEDGSKVATARMEKVLKVVSDKFNLTDGNFVLTGFSDKNTKFQMSLSNEDFDITILMKDTEKFEIE